MLRRVALVRTDVSEERIASIIRAAKIDELRTTLAVTSSVLRLLITANIVPSSSICVALMMEVIPYSENSDIYKSKMVSHPRRRHSS
jgi:hypothetical protein